MESSPESKWLARGSMKMIREERTREEYARGWLRPNARWGGVSTNSSGRTIWGGDVVEGDSAEGGIRDGDWRNKSEKTMAKRNSIPQQRIFRWGRSREMKYAKGNNTPILSREEWDCLADEVAWKEYVICATPSHALVHGTF